MNPRALRGEAVLRDAYLYMRFSTAEQAKGDTLARQRALANEYVLRHPEKQLRLITEHEYVDEGVSSFAGQNLQPGRALHRFLDDVKAGRVSAGSVLMVESLDRISRQQVLESQRLLLDLLVSNINVITTSPAEEREYSRTSGLHDLIISLAGMERANQESAMKSERVRRAWKRKKECATQLKLTSRAPAWLRLSPDRSHFEVLEEKAAIVRRTFDLAATMGQHAIARILNSEGIKPLMGGSSGWHSSSLVKLLTSQAVIGVYQPHERDKKSGRRIPDGPPIQGYYPRIIDDETFYRVQTLRSGRKGVAAGRKGERFSNLFTGIAKCASCRAPMVMVNKGKPPKGGAYLVCSSARRRLGCEYRSVRYLHIEHAFYTMCREIDVARLLPARVESAESVRLRNLQAAITGEITEKRDLLDRTLAALTEIKGQVAQAINDKLVQYEERISALELKQKEVAKELARAEVSEARSAGLQKEFIELLTLIQNSEKAEQYVLRSRFNDLLKTALADFAVGPAPPDLEGDLNEAISVSQKVLENAIPAVDILQRSHESLHRRVSGSLSVVTVAYRNGWATEIAVDARGVIGVRSLRISDSADIELAPNKMPDGQWGVVVASSAAKGRKKQLRNANGKFIVAPADA